MKNRLFHLISIGFIVIYCFFGIATSQEFDYIPLNMSVDSLSNAIVIQNNDNFAYNTLSTSLTIGTTSTFPDSVVYNYNLTLASGQSDTIFFNEFINGNANALDSISLPTTFDVYGPVEAGEGFFQYIWQ